MRILLEDVLESASELLWPIRCVGCNVPGELLCEDCRAELPWINKAWACPVCGAPYGWLTCTACKRDWELDSCSCAFSYEGSIAKLVNIFKDGHELRLAKIVSSFLAQLIPNDPPDILCFVPATSKAVTRRGYDHMQLVCEELSRATGIELLDVLVREEGLDQRVLSREERQGNLSGSVSVLEDVSSMSVLLVDDVITTGASMRECARALSSRGASQVFGLALARVW